MFFIVHRNRKRVAMQNIGASFLLAYGFAMT
jgi:hypothetical protein